MLSKKISIDNTIEERIQWAKDCYETYRELFSNDKKTEELLDNLRLAAEVSHKTMVDAGILAECRKCVDSEGGSCCGAGLENKYSGVLILTNLLLGVLLPDSRYDPKGCYFLGETGCTLLARHVICINYLCKKITDTIDKKRIAILRDKEGLEIGILFLLNERLKEILKNELYD